MDMILKRPSIRRSGLKSGGGEQLFLKGKVSEDNDMMNMYGRKKKLEKKIIFGDNKNKGREK